jgi:hypothetical protein
VERRPPSARRRRALSSRRRRRLQASCRRPWAALAHRAEKRQLRLLVAGDDPRVEAVVGAQPVDELPRRSSCRAPRSSEPRCARPRRAPRSPRRSRRASCARARCPASPSRPVDRRPRRGASPRVRRSSSSSVPSGVDVGDQQPRRVGADIDDSDAHQPTGFGIGRPSSAASRFSTASSVIFARVAVWVAEPMWGSTIRFGAASSGSSRPAAARGRSRRAPRRRSCPARSAADERRLIDDGPAGGVDEDRRRLHQRERAQHRSSGGSPPSAGSAG